MFDKRRRLTVDTFALRAHGSVLKDPEVDSFDAVIDWAPAVKAPSNVPRFS